MGILALDETDRVTEWQEKPKHPKSDLASMGVYVFSKRALRKWLSEDRHDFGRDVIPAMLDGGARVFGYHFEGYWQDVGTIQSLLGGEPRAARGQRRARPVRPRLADPHPVRGARAGPGRPDRPGPSRSLISHGCVINGTVVNSRPVAGRPRRRRRGVRDSIVMFDSVIRSGAVVDRAILDKEVVVGPGAIVGDGPDLDTPNKQEPGRLNTGITVVGKRSVIPRGVADRPEREDRGRREVRPTSRAGSSRAAPPSSRRDRPRPRLAWQRRTGAPSSAWPLVAASRPRRTGTASAGVRGRDARDRFRRRLGGLRPARARPGLAAAHGPDRRPTVDCPPCLQRSRAASMPAPRRRSSAGSTSWGSSRLARADRDGVTSWDLRLDGRRRFDLPDHPDPRPGAGTDLLGPLRAADRRRLPQVVSEAAPLERRVPVREVLARRGRAAGAGDRAPGRGRWTATSSASRSRGPSPSPTSCSRSRPAGCGSAAGSRTRAGPREPRRGAARALRGPARRA